MNGTRNTPKNRSRSIIFLNVPTKRNYKSLGSYWGWLKWLTHGKKLWFSIFDKDIKQLHKEIATC